MNAVDRWDVEFTSGGCRCAAWLYLPAGNPRPPVVVMAHGFGGERTFRLPAFAERFAAAGMAVVLFDYRTFGASEGAPRHLIRPGWQLQDWRAAIDFARRHEKLDGTRIALWGSSFSGGHVIRLAAEDPSIRAIISQVPYVDPISSSKLMGMRYVGRCLVASLRDLLHALVRARPYSIPIYGPPGSMACLATDEAAREYPALIPDGSAWENQCPARCLLYTAFYRPRSWASRVSAAALVIVAEGDRVVSPGAIRRTAARMPNATLRSLPGGHFAIYHGDAFEQAVKWQVEFLREKLA